jgi:E3 ubiquitin-protein ligase TRIP12
MFIFSFNRSSSNEILSSVSSTTASSGANFTPLEWFEFLGTFIAKAILDGRVLDLPLSRPFLKLMLQQRLTFMDWKEIEPTVATQFEPFLELAHRLEQLHQQNQQETGDTDEMVVGDGVSNDIVASMESSTQPTSASSSASSASSSLMLTMANGTQCAVESLDLDFTLPGDPSWHLKKDGDQVTVTNENVNDYVSAVIRAHLVDGVSQQLHHFQMGFDRIFPMKNLRAFTVDELQTLICGNGDSEKWTMESK